MPKKSDRTKTRDLLKEVKSISVKTGELKQIVESLPDSSVKDAFNYSVLNLEKKIKKFTSVSVSLTDAQKEKLRKFREALIAETQEEIPKVSANMEKPITKGKKH